MASVTSKSPIVRSSCSLQYLRKPHSRFFSTSRLHAAQAGQAGREVMRNMPKQKSVHSRMKRLKRSEIPTDIGLMPMTFIRPCGKMPSWFSQPRIRARLEWYYFRQSASDFFNAVYQNRWNQPKDPLTNKTKKLPMILRERSSIARDLYTELYTAIAQQDRNTISKIACSGLANQQIGNFERLRIAGAKPSTWTVKFRGSVLSPRIPFTLQALIPSFFKAAHVVADRAMQIPVGPGIMVRQMIVRIDSKQTITPHNGSPHTQKYREYVVLQKMMMQEEPGEDGATEEGEEGWRIWGTVEPTETEAALEIISATKTQTGTVMDRFRNMMPTNLPGGMSNPM